MQEFDQPEEMKDEVKEEVEEIIKDEELEFEDEWLDILGSGDLKKKVVKAGIGESRPSKGCTVVVQVSGQLEDGTQVDTHDKLTFTIGDSEVILGLDMVLPLMDKGEVAEVYMASRFAYGSTGLPPSIPGDSSITYQVELVDYAPEQSPESVPLVQRMEIGNHVPPKNSPNPKKKMASASQQPAFMHRRASPISLQERAFIIDLVKSEEILANRSTEGKIVGLKKLAWERIALQVNAAGFGERKTVYQLQKIWERIKAKVKREHAQIKRKCRKTGGGPPPPTLGDESQKAITVLDSEVDDLGCEFDSDTTRLNKMVIVDKSELQLIPEEKEVQHVAAAVATSDSITLEPLPTTNALADSLMWSDTSDPRRLVSEGVKEAVNSQQANTPAASGSPPPQRPVHKKESAARDRRNRRFETSFPALEEGTMCRKMMFTQQQQLIKMQKETEAMRQELLRVQLSEAETRARIALLEEEALKKKLN